MLFVTPQILFRLLFGRFVQQAGNLSKAFNETPVVVGHAEETAEPRLIGRYWSDSQLFCTVFSDCYPI